MDTAHVTTYEGARRISWIGGTVHHILIDGEQSHGRQTLVRTTFTGGAASPVHVHDRDDETLHVIDGSLTVWAGKQRWQIGAGDTVFLPRGLPHA